MENSRKILSAQGRLATYLHMIPSTAVCCCDM